MKEQRVLKCLNSLLQLRFATPYIVFDKSTETQFIRTSKERTARRTLHLILKDWAGATRGHKLFPRLQTYHINSGERIQNKLQKLGASLGLEQDPEGLKPRPQRFDFRKHKDISRKHCINSDLFTLKTHIKVLKRLKMHICWFDDLRRLLSIMLKRSQKPAPRWSKECDRICKTPKKSTMKKTFRRSMRSLTGLQQERKQGPNKMKESRKDFQRARSVVLLIIIHVFLWYFFSVHYVTRASSHPLVRNSADIWSASTMRERTFASAAMISAIM